MNKFLIEVHVKFWPVKLSNKKPTPSYNSSLTFKDKQVTTNIDKANEFNKQSINTVTHKTHRNNQKIPKKVKSLSPTPITLTEDQTKHALKKQQITWA